MEIRANIKQTFISRIIKACCTVILLIALRKQIYNNCALCFDAVHFLLKADLHSVNFSELTCGTTDIAHAQRSYLTRARLSVA